MCDRGNDILNALRKRLITKQQDIQTSQEVSSLAAAINDDNVLLQNYPMIMAHDSGTGYYDSIIGVIVDWA